MPAHLRSIVPATCTCGARATVIVYTATNERVGARCVPCGTRLVDRLNKSQEESHDE